MVVCLHRLNSEAGLDNKTRRIWAGLVGYANGTATANKIRATIVDCAGWIAATMPSEVLDPMVFEGDLSKQAEAYRPAVKILLRFLCSAPKSEERNSLKDPAIAFLLEHGGHIQGRVFREAHFTEEHLRNLNYTPNELESFRKQIKRYFNQAQYWENYRGQPMAVGEDILPLGLLLPSRGYKDFADPICDFLSSEYEKYLNREVSRKDKKTSPIVPIFACPKCNKLVMPKRVGRRHHCSECSDRARAEKYRQKASPDEGRDYAWLNRLLHQEPGVRKTRQGQRKVQERVSEIKSRQKNSRRCQRLLQALRL
jgi:hypothetical protein